MQIINSSSALGKLTRWAQWADAVVLTDTLYPSHTRDHAPQLQPLIVLKWPSHAGMDWTRSCGCVGSGDWRWGALQVVDAAHVGGKLMRAPAARTDTVMHDCWLDAEIAVLQTVETADR